MFPTTGDMQKFMELASKTLGIDAKRAFLNFGDTGHQRRSGDVYVSCLACEVV